MDREYTRLEKSRDSKNVLSKRIPELFLSLRSQVSNRINFVIFITFIINDKWGTNETRRSLSLSEWIYYSWQAWRNFLVVQRAYLLPNTDDTRWSICVTNYFRGDSFNSSPNMCIIRFSFTWPDSMSTRISLSLCICKVVFYPFLQISITSLTSRIVTKNFFL